MANFKAQLNSRCAAGNKLAVDLYTDDPDMGVVVEGHVHIDFFDNLVSEDARERIENGEEVEFRLVEVEDE